MMPVLTPATSAEPPLMLMSNNNHVPKQASRKRRVGRPRGFSASATKPSANATEDPTQKRTRGPKPKYVFPTPDEAMDARKERNRKAALESYYRKRQRVNEMEQEMNRLMAENKLLESLADEMEKGVTTLEEASERGIDVWLAAQTMSPSER